MVVNDYGIINNFIYARNSQAKVTEVHQTIGNIMSAFTTNNLELEDEIIGEEIVSSAMFAIRSKIHTNMQYTPSQLVFGRVSILNTKGEVNWQ